MKLEYEQLKTEKLQNSYNALMGQINPHFFFNSLNGLNALIQSGEKQQTLAYLDSVMAVKQASLDSIKGNYVLEKDTAYQEVGNYFYPTQVVEKNIGRSFLRAQVSET